MNPYLQAHEEYHRYGVPGWSWDEILTEHLHHGAMVATDEAFILARKVRREWPQERLFDLSEVESSPQADCWMVWIAAGRLDSLLWLSRSCQLHWVAFTRRDSNRLRFYRLHQLLRHGFPENSKTDSTPTASHRHWPGKSSC